MLSSLFLPRVASVIVKAFAWTMLLRSDAPFGGAPLAGVAREQAARVVVPGVDGLAAAVGEATAAPRRPVVGASHGAPPRKARLRTSPALAAQIDDFLARRP